jgi:hypothetical protein
MATCGDGVVEVEPVGVAGAAPWGIVEEEVRAAAIKGGTPGIAAGMRMDGRAPGRAV